MSDSQWFCGMKAPFCVANQCLICALPVSVSWSMLKTAPGAKSDIIRFRLCVDVALWKFTSICSIW